MNSDTPRTNEEMIDATHCAECGYEVVLADAMRTLERELQEETAIVSRIWKILGSPTYEELNGKSIYELIEERINAK